MKCFLLALCILVSKKLYGGRLRCCCKSKHRHIGLLTIPLDFAGNHIFHIRFRIFSGSKRHRDSSHIFTGCRRMCLVNDDGKPLVLQISYTINDIWEFLNRCCNNLCIAIQRNRQVRGHTLIIHHTDESSLVFHTHDGFLQLPIYNNSVCNNNNIIKNDLVIGIMQ